MYGNLLGAFNAGFCAAWAIAFLAKRDWTMVVFSVALCVVNVILALT